jgi:hypothetical protein
VEAFCTRFPLGRALLRSLQNRRQGRHHCMWKRVLQSDRDAETGVVMPALEGNYVTMPTCAMPTSTQESLVGLLRLSVTGYETVYTSWWLDTPYALEPGEDILSALSDWEGWAGDRDLLSLFKPAPTVCESRYALL